MGESVDRTHHNGRSMWQDLMTISVGAEKVFDKTQNSRLKKCKTGKQKQTRSRKILI